MRTPNWPQPFAKFLRIIGPILNQLLRWPIPAQMFEEFTSFTDCPLFCSPYISLLAHVTLTPNLKNIGFYSVGLRQKSSLISSVWWGAEPAKPSVWVQFICRPCHPGNGSLCCCEMEKVEPPPSERPLFTLGVSHPFFDYVVLN